MQPETGTAPVTTSAAARILKQSEGSVRLQAKSGRLPCTTTEGGLRLFDPNQLRAIAAERERGAQKRNERASG